MKKKFSRTPEGLRDAIMAEMEDIKDGIANAAEALAFADLAEKVIDSFELDFEIQRHKDKLEYQLRQEAWEQKQHARMLLIDASNAAETV